MAKFLQLKVVLLGIEPEIWRRVVVPNTLTLLELHAVLQGAMGWQDYHLHSYDIGGRRYEVPETGEYGPEEGCLDERKFTLKKALKGVPEFSYVYDFGDNWQHRIETENVMSTFPRRMHWPICIGGKNACPREDCGGAYNFPESLPVLKDAGHPEHLSTKDWAGAFDPDEFSVNQATLLIQATCAIYLERGIGFTE